MKKKIFVLLAVAIVGLGIYCFSAVKEPATTETYAVESDGTVSSLSDEVVSGVVPTPY